MKYTKNWSEQQPRYQHDCDKCEFLGTHKQFDLYACGNKDPKDEDKIEVNTVIARYSSESGDYSSGATFGFIGDGPLKIAMARVIYQRFRFTLHPSIIAEAFRYVVEPIYVKIATTEED